MIRRVQQCRLCGSPIEATLTNPRRVCAACGEVNLPTDRAPPEPARRAPAVAVVPARIATTVAVTFALIALPTPVGGLLTDLVLGGQRGASLEQLALGTAFFCVLGLLGLSFFGATRTTKERQAMALTALPALIVGWEACRYAFLVTFFHHWRF